MICCSPSSNMYLIRNFNANTCSPPNKGFCSAPCHTEQRATCSRRPGRVHRLERHVHHTPGTPRGPGGSPTLCVHIVCSHLRHSVRRTDHREHTTWANWHVRSVQACCGSCSATTTSSRLSATPLQRVRTWAGRHSHPCTHQAVL